MNETNQETGDNPETKNILENMAELVANMRDAEVSNLEFQLERLQLVLDTSGILLSVNLFWMFVDVMSGLNADQMLGPQGGSYETILRLAGIVSVLGIVYAAQTARNLRERINILNRSKKT